MQLCLMIEGQEDVSWPDWVALARACEEHGVAALFRSDHYMNLDGRHPERAALDAWSTVCALAALTSTLRLGTMVSPATFRHPSNLAKLATSAPHRSNFVFFFIFSPSEVQPVCSLERTRYGTATSTDNSS